MATLDTLRATYRPGNNLGVRLGDPSRTTGGYLHVLDLDIRVADLADEVWEALTELLPGLDLTALPCVQSGSGGESRHLYFCTDKPFRSKKLWVSEGKHRSANGKWHYDAEIELFGSGKQVVAPPSIHPDTGKPYVWLRAFDFDDLDLGLADWPTIPSAAIDRLNAAAHEEMPFEAREPLTFTDRQLTRTLDDIADERIDDYHDWVTLGQALHHQFGAGMPGFELWFRHSARSPKFDPSARREMLRKWRGFGRNRRKPVTMASVVEWAQEARVAAYANAFDDLDEDQPTADAPESTDFDDLLGGAKSDLDLLGGSDDEDEDPLKALLAREADWVSLLDLNESGTIKPTLHNVELMVRNDQRLVGLPQLNDFTLEIVQRIQPGTKANRRANSAKQTRQLGGRVWQVKDQLNGDLWSDARDNAVRSILEAPKTQGGYGVKVTDRDLDAAVEAAANDNAFHPVREYLERTRWDGVPRVETLFTDYVGAPLNAYTRSVSRLMLVAAVTRIYEPGAKFDSVVILEGLQGKRKSTFIRVLGREWFGELNCNWDDSKQAIEQMAGKWILELPELSGLNKSDVRSIKSFVSTQSDRARLAYARRASEFPRQCIFVGSTNDTAYLRDQTGGRRFWPIACDVDEIDTAALERDIDQLWAEALHLYREMRSVKPQGTLPLYLVDPEAQAIAAQLQESRREETVEDALAGEIRAWLDAPVQTGSIDDDASPTFRNETCLKQVWVEALNRSFESL